MGSQKIKEHVVSILKGQDVERNKNIKDYFICLVYRWCDFITRPSTKAKAILLLNLGAVILDPFFFYIPVVKNASTCLDLDNTLRIIVVVFRSFVDVLHTILWWHRRMSLVSCTVAILSVLPLPQVVIFVVSWQLFTMRLLKFVVLIQLVLRLYRIFPAYKYAVGTNPYELLSNAWLAAAFNLVLYTLASNVLGAFWYLRAIEQTIGCWRGACHKNVTFCGDSSLYCDGTSSYNEYLHKYCSIPQASDRKSYDYGIYEEAFETNIIETGTPFLNKFFQCFYWGLRNLSSLGQNLKTSNNIWDSFFVIAIAIFGLVLFALLIGNMQAYLQTIWSKETLDVDPVILERTKKRNISLQIWRPFYLIPVELRKEIICCEDPKWQETSEVNLESLLNNTPTALRKKLRPHLCKDMFEKIPRFKNLRNGPRDKLLVHAKPLVFSQRSYILREGDPIHELVYVVDGDLLAYSTQIGVPAKRLSMGCFFGEELLRQWKQAASQQEGPDENLPIASITVQAITKVEVFALSAKDLEKVFTWYHGFLYESDIRDWASSVIQQVYVRSVAKARGRSFMEVSYSFQDVK